MNELKEIILKPDKPFHNNVDVAVIDFTDKGERQRCKIKVEFAKSDVEQLQAQGYGLAEAMNAYKDWLYNTVKVHLAQEWKPAAGYEEVMKIIEDKVRLYY